MSMNFNIRLIKRIFTAAVMVFVFGFANAQENLSLREIKNRCRGGVMNMINKHISDKKERAWKDPTENKRAALTVAQCYMVRSQFLFDEEVNEWQNAIDVLNGKIRLRSGRLLNITLAWDPNQKLTRTFLLAICFQKLAQYDSANALYDTIIVNDVPRSLAIFNKSIILLNDSSWTSAENLLSSLLNEDDARLSDIFPNSLAKYPRLRDRDFMDDAQFLLACCKYYNQDSLALATNKKLRLEILAEFAKIERFYPGSDLAELVESQAFEELIKFVNGKDNKIIEKLFNAYMITLKNGLVSKKELTNNYRN